MEHERGEQFTAGRTIALSSQRCAWRGQRSRRQWSRRACTGAARTGNGDTRGAPSAGPHWHQQEASCRLVAQAWAASDSGSAFVAALAEQGLRLAQGDKCAVVVDGTGNTHSLQRMLAMDARATSINARRAAETRQGWTAWSCQECRKHGRLSRRLLYHCHLRMARYRETHAHAWGRPGRTWQHGRSGIYVVTPAAVNMVAMHQCLLPSIRTWRDVGGCRLRTRRTPRPGAHLDEIARYTNALHAHAERKRKAMQAFMRVAAAASEASHQAATVGGGHRGTTQQLTTHDWQQWWLAAVGTAIAAGYTAEEARYAVSASGLDTRDSSITAHVYISQRGAEGTTVQDAVKARDILLEAKGANVSSS